jgi:AmiR/NasT family two-component response regulator
MYRVRYAQRVSQTPFRVLIAEDEALIRLDLKEMLEEDGYVVAGEAADGEAAVTLTHDLRPDLVIMDIKMPVLDGVSAAERITEAHLAPVVILTAFSQSELVKRASDAGAMAYLVKPFTKADLIPAIEIAVSRFAEISALETEVGTLRERLEVRKLLDRAKGILQADRSITEGEAFRWIQKTSMDRRMTMRAVAEEVLAAHTAQAEAAKAELAQAEAAQAETAPADPDSPGSAAPGAGPASSAPPGSAPPGSPPSPASLGSVPKPGPAKPKPGPPPAGGPAGSSPDGAPKA